MYWYIGLKVVVVVDMTCIIGHRNLPYKANLKSGKLCNSALLRSIRNNGTTRIFGNKNEVCLQQE